MKIIKTIIHKLIYTCEEATYHIELKAGATHLNILENLRLKSHLTICKLCKVYEKKVLLIEQAMERIADQPNENINKIETEDFINKIKNNIKDN